jgi:hypothetical protein
MESVDILPQKRLLSSHIISEYTNQFRSSGGTDVAKVAELLLESTAFYDAEMIAELINTMLKHTNNNAIKSYCSRSKQYNESTKSCKSFYSMISPARIP